jgi:tRNA-dihydrouridine synthase
MKAMALSSKSFLLESRYIDINFGCPVKKVVCKELERVLKDVDLMIGQKRLLIVPIYP